MRHLALLLVFLLLPVVVQARTAVTQRDWALQVIDSLGWSFGLPEKPTDNDFIRLLNGNRKYRIEAEEVFRRDDRVTMMTFTSFGKYSGEGWLSGTREQTEVHLEFNLPHTGRYRVLARVRLGGHQLSFGQQTLLLDGGDLFTDVEAGYVDLQAGPQEVLLQLQPNGSIDYLELVAEPIGPIVPAKGWQFDNELTFEVAARTVVQALNLQKALPPGRQVIKLEAENLPRPNGVQPQHGNSRGRASGGRYLQVGAAPVRLGFYAANVSGGVTDLVLRAAGSKPIKVKLPGHLEIQSQFSPRFEDNLLGTFFIPEGEMTVEVILPAGAAIDRLELRSRRGGVPELLRLVGLDGLGRLPVRDINSLSALIGRLKEMR